MVGAGDNGGVYHQLDEFQCLLLDAMTTQMKRLLKRNNEELYRRRKKREQERDNSEASHKNRKRKSDTQERESDNSNKLNIYVSPSVQPLLQEFKDVFPKEIPHGLPLSRSIEHQVNLLPEASLPNRPTYNNKPQET
ncbi:hypothetical protein GmHk_08G023055 [Glycine max]|nr:hypothetical protein GmHk_08G023055 [Glycine max]